MKVIMFNRLCVATFPCLILYNEIRSNILQVPFKIALSSGRYGVNAGGVAGPGIRCRLSTITTAITNIVTPVTNLKINLSVMLIEFGDQY
jgi:hypothetical protein